MNVAGFSPFKLVLGTNPRLPSILTDDVPALTKTSTSIAIRDNLNALHAARTSFIACENDAKIKRALSTNVRSSGEIEYVTGDTVHHKRDDENQWHGPATVIGQVDKVAFLKHGSFEIRVHPCRMQLIREAKRTITELPNNQILEQITNKNSIKNASININPNDTHHNSNNQNSTSNENDLSNNQSITDNSNSQRC